MVGLGADDDRRDAVGLEVDGDGLPLVEGGHRARDASDIDGGRVVAGVVGGKEVGGKLVFAFFEQHLLIVVEDAGAPALTHPQRVLSALAVLGLTGEETAILLVGGSEGIEVIGVARPVIEGPSLGHIDGAVAGDTAAAHDAVGVLEVAVDERRGIFFLLVGDVLQSANLLLREAYIVEAEAIDGAAEVLVVGGHVAVPPLCAADVVTRVRRYLRQHIRLVLVLHAAGIHLAVDVDGGLAGGGIVGDSHLIRGAGLQRRGAADHRRRSTVVFDACCEGVGTQEEAVARGGTEVVEARLLGHRLGRRCEQDGVGTEACEQALGGCDVGVRGEARGGVRGQVDVVVGVAHILGDVARQCLHRELAALLADGGCEGDILVFCDGVEHAVVADDLLVVGGPCDVKAQLGGRQDEVRARLGGQFEHRQGILCLLGIQLFLHRLDEALHGERRGAGVVVALHQQCVGECVEVGCAALQGCGLNDLIDEAVAIGGEHLAVIGHGENPCPHLRGVVVATGASGVGSPVVAGEQTVLAAIGGIADGDDGVVVAVDGVSHVAQREEGAGGVLRGIHGHGQVERFVLAEAVTVHAKGHFILRRQLLVPCTVHADICGIALGIVLLHHPVEVITVHPRQAQG